MPTLDHVTHHHHHHHHHHHWMGRSNITHMEDADASHLHAASGLAHLDTLEGCDCCFHSETWFPCSVQTYAYRLLVKFGAASLHIRDALCSVFLLFRWLLRTTSEDHITIYKGSEHGSWWREFALCLWNGLLSCGRFGLSSPVSEGRRTS